MAKQSAKAATPAAKSNGKTVAVSNKQALSALLGKPTVTGFEEVTAAAYAIPFLRILQDLSPQVKSKMNGYIKGAKPGQIFNTATKALCERLRVVPCYFQQTQIEWRPRGKAGGGGSGFVMAHPANTPLLQRVTRDEKSNKNLLPSGNELADTRSHFVIALPEGSPPEGCLLAMGSSGIKVSKGWVSMMRVARAPTAEYPAGLPMFAYSYELWTEEVSNDKGQWFQWCVGNKEPISALDNAYEVAAEAQSFAQAAAAGTRKVDYDNLRDETQPEHQGGGGGFAGVPADLDNEIDA